MSLLLVGTDLRLETLRCIGGVQVSCVRSKGSCLENKVKIA